MRILASDGIEKSAAAALAAQGHEVVQEFYQPEELAEKVKEFDVLVVRSATKVRKPIIDAAASAGRLKLIIRGGVGIDNIDHVYAEEKGIKVMNTPRASSDSVAELALAHMFSVARFINIAGHTMRVGQWEKKAYKGIELSGRTIGIIGYGRIGQALGRRAQALGMKVVAYDIYKIPELENENMRYVEMDELYAVSDFISLHTPSIDGKPLINADTIAKMKDGVIIINTSRGNNLDEQALLDALNSGKVYGAGLDVFSEEPSKNEALLAHPRVSCTPHIGASTSEAQKRIGAEIVDIIAKFFA
ncbi:MAG: D-2-hydroxyacid dehydrogenase [Clostridia bacterium]|nr:D-2-hydroxyacid dehydrogenase [Clostridia bacterium]